MVLQEGAINGDVEVPEVAISYGLFLNTIVTFLIVAFSIFMVVEGYSKMKETLNLDLTPQEMEQTIVLSPGYS